MEQLSIIQLVAQQVSDFWLLQAWGVTFFVLCIVEALFTTPRPPLKPAPEIVTDMFHWMMSPTVRVLCRLLSVVVLLAAATLMGVDPGPTLQDGFGPISEQPKWLIMIELVVLMDLVTYWMHRLFHTVPWLWRFHAIHHSAKFVRWSTTARVHPVNEFVTYLATLVPFFLLGFPLGAVVPLMPLINLWVTSAHTQWNVAFGPLGKLLVSPRFHHWHHTHSDEGGNKNFANLFALWDWLFGTYYLPEGQRPVTFGLDEDDVAENYWQQLVYPFRRRQGSDRQVPAPAAQAAPPSPSP